MAVGEGGTVASILGGVPITVKTTRGGPSLAGVACPRRNLCLAVGHDGAGEGVVVPIFHGTPLTPLPVSGATALEGITCPRRFLCLAVGHNAASAGVLVPVVARLLALY